MNATKSCGPKSADGKSRAARNAVTHGSLAKIESLPEADREEFRTLLEALRDEWRPADLREDPLVVDIAIGTFMKWRSLGLDCEFLGIPETADRKPIRTRAVASRRPSASRCRESRRVWHRGTPWYSCSPHRRTRRAPVRHRVEDRIQDWVKAFSDILRQESQQQVAVLLHNWSILRSRR